MKKITKFGIGIIITVVVLASLWMYHTHELYEKSHRSEYEYEIIIESNSILHNITLFVPLPVLEGGSRVGDEIMTGNTSKPDDWNFSIVETEHGKMLKISAEKIAPKPPLPVPGEGTDWILVKLQADEEINTKNSIGNEPLLSPKYNLTSSDCEFPYPEGRTLPNCYEYESRIYADYVTSSDAKVSIYVEIEGRNSWWVYGWSGNNYRDQIEITFIGEQHGWYVALGKLVIGEGRYGWM